MSNFSGYSKSQFNHNNLSDNQIKTYYFSSENEFGEHYIFSKRFNDDTPDNAFEMNCVVKIANEY